MSTLHDRIRAVVEQRLRIARAAVDGHTGVWKHNGPYESWLITDAGDVVVYDEGSPTEVPAEHIAANDPADAILGAEHALWTLDEHKPRQLHPFGALCEGCSITEGEPVLRFVEYPCRSILALATRWRVEVEG